MVICWLTESQYRPKFIYEQLLNFILIALRFLSLNRVACNCMYLAHTAVYIHIYVFVYTVTLPLSTPWRLKWSGVIAPLILTSSLDGDVSSASPTGQFTTGREHKITLNKRLVVTTALFGRLGRTENILSLPEFEPQTFQAITTRHRYVRVYICLLMCMHICLAYINVYINCLWWSQFGCIFSHV